MQTINPQNRRKNAEISSFKLFLALRVKQQDLYLLTGNVTLVGIEMFIILKTKSVTAERRKVLNLSEETSIFEIFITTSL